MPAMVGLQGCVPASAWLNGEIPIPTHLRREAEDVNSEDCVTSEVYVPWWMSRKVLNTQLRSQERPIPLGFHAQRRRERRKRQQEWLHEFLQAFWPDAPRQSDAVMAATREWPQNDRNDGNSEVAEEAEALPKATRNDEHILCGPVLLDALPEAVEDDGVICLVTDRPHPSPCALRVQEASCDAGGSRQWPAEVSQRTAPHQ